MQRAFPANFPDHERENAERLQRALLVEIDEIVNPDDVSLEARRKGVELELLETLKPPLMAGAGNIPDAIREGYRNNLMALQGEGLPVSHLTPAFEFWDYIRYINDKYRKQ